MGKRKTILFRQSGNSKSHSSVFITLLGCNLIPQHISLSPIVALTKRFFPPNKALKTVSRIIYSNKPLVQLSSIYKKSSPQATPLDSVYRPKKNILWPHLLFPLKNKLNSFDFFSKIKFHLPGETGHHQFGNRELKGPLIKINFQGGKPLSRARLGKRSERNYRSGEKQTRKRRIFFFPRFFLCTHIWRVAWKYPHLTVQKRREKNQFGDSPFPRLFIAN